MVPIELREFVDEHGRNPFRKWLLSLDNRAAVRIGKFLERLVEGNLSNVKGVGKGVCEIRVDFGPGYRIYFGWDGPVIVILLGGGTKKQQQKDIENAQSSWTRYKETHHKGR